MIVNFVLVAVGLVVLTFAADQLVLGASRLAMRLRISPVVVGVVVIGLGTSAPEFLVSGLAAARGDAGIAVGNLAGSNILNVTLILGIAALVRDFAVSSTVVRREVRLSVAAVAVFGVAAWIGLSVWTGAVLLAGAAGAAWLLVRWSREGPDLRLAADASGFTEAGPALDVVAAAPASRWADTARAVLGLGGVLLGAQLLVSNAARIAERFGVSHVVIGFTLVAIGTSLPELVTTVAAQRRGESDLVVGNLFGSNLFNSLAGGVLVGFAAGTTPLHRPAVGMTVAMLLTAMVAWAIVRRGLRVTRIEGAVLLVAYLVSVPLILTE
jgi:cation:H+ antiporter